MKEYYIALAPGDGVGPEVVSAARKVLETIQESLGTFTFQFEEYPVGKGAYDSYGTPLPEKSLQAMRSSDAAILGAMATGLVPPPSPMGQLRRELDLFADVRPIKSVPGIWSLRPDIDIICVRENTEGFLADRNLYKGYGEFMPTDELVMSVRVLTRAGIEKITRYAFELARREKRKKVTAVHKSNVLRYGDGFFLDVVREVAQNYPDIELDDEYVDSVANNLITAPERYDIIVTTNLFGDIISDEAAALVSNLVPSANIGPEAAVFRPIHEAVPEEAGRNTINPLSAILCGSMLLRHLGEPEAGGMIDTAVSDLLLEGNVRTRDLGGDNTTSEITDALCEKIKNNACINLVKKLK